MKSIKILALLASALAINADTLPATFSAFHHLRPLGSGDTLVQGYHQTFYLNCELSDSSDLKYLAIGIGTARYEIINYTSNLIIVWPIQLDAWDNSYCMFHNIDSLELLNPSFSDSVASYLGNVANSNGITVLPHAAEELGSINLSQTRVFLKWDSNKRKTIAVVAYEISIIPQQGSVLISSNDSIKVGLNWRSLYAADFQERIWTTSDLPSNEIANSRIISKQSNSISVLRLDNKISKLLIQTNNNSIQINGKLIAF